MSLVIGWVLPRLKSHSHMSPIWVLGESHVTQYLIYLSPMCITKLFVSYTCIGHMFDICCEVWAVCPSTKRVQLKGKRYPKGTTERQKDSNQVTVAAAEVVVDSQRDVGSSNCCSSLTSTMVQCWSTSLASTPQNLLQTQSSDLNPNLNHQNLNLACFLSCLCLYWKIPAVLPLNSQVCWESERFILISNFC